VNEVERIESIKNDYLVLSNNIRMFDDNSFAVNDMNFGINSFAHGQVAEKLSIPKKYYDAMEAIPGLRTINVNEWLREKQDSKYLVRTLDGTARAFLSDRYRPIDNYDVLSSFLPVIKGMDVKIQPNTLSLTETKMYIPVIFPTLEGEVKKGDAALTRKSLQDYIEELISQYYKIEQVVITRKQIENKRDIEKKQVDDLCVDVNVIKEYTVETVIEALIILTR